MRLAFDFAHIINKELIILNMNENYLYRDHFDRGDYKEDELFNLNTLNKEINYNLWYDDFKKNFKIIIKKLIKKFYKLDICFNKNSTSKLNLIYTQYINYYNNKNNFLINTKYNLLKSYFLFILNIKKKKPFINIIVKNKTLLAVSAGFVLKKLNISEKKIKKSLKTLYLILKIVINNLNKNINKNNKIIFQIKGTKKKLPQVILFLKKKIKFDNIIFIYTPNFYQNSIKFKKIKSIKKRLRKKFIKK